MSSEVSIDRDGLATIALRLGWRVSGGRLQQFELTELPSDAALIDASATTPAGSPVPLATRSPAPGRLEVHLGDESTGGVRRGTLEVVLRYSTSLRATGAIRRAGPDAVVEFTTVPWERSLESSELRLSLPTGPRRAQWLSDDTTGVESSASNEIAHDVIHLARRHLPAGTRWTARVAADASVFPWLHGPSVAGRSPRSDARLPWARVVGTGLCAVVVALLGARSIRARRCASDPRPKGMRALALGLAVAGVVGQSLTAASVPWALTLGTAALAAAALAYDSPSRDDRPRPPSSLTPSRSTIVAALVLGALALVATSTALAVVAVDLTLLAWCAGLRRGPAAFNDA